jgi:5-methylcytosine-specific restriction endonuclease McrA
MNGSPGYHLLRPEHTDPRRLKRERERTRELRQSAWWKAKVAAGVCHYCRQKVASSELTLDHVIPLARGGQSVKSNVVAACLACNRTKKLDTPVDQILDRLASEG